MHKTVNPNPSLSPNPNGMIRRPHQPPTVAERHLKHLGRWIGFPGFEDGFQSVPRINLLSCLYIFDRLRPILSFNQSASNQTSDFVTPCVVMLRTPQTFGFVCGVRRGYRTVRPCEPPFRRFVNWTVPRWTHAEQAAFTFDHDITSVGGGRGHEGNPHLPVILDAIPDPLGTRTRLAPSTARQRNPGTPGAARRPLFFPCTMMSDAIARRKAARARFAVPVEQVGVRVRINAYPFAFHRSAVASRRCWQSLQLA